MFGFSVLIACGVCFGLVRMLYLGTGYAAWNIGSGLIRGDVKIHWVSFWKAKV